MLLFPCERKKKLGPPHCKVVIRFYLAENRDREEKEYVAFTLFLVNDYIGELWSLNCI